MKLDFSKKDVKLINGVEQLMLSKQDFRSSPDWSEYAKKLCAQGVGYITVDTAKQRIHYYKNMPKDLKTMGINLANCLEHKSQVKKGKNVFINTISKSNNNAFA